MGPYLESPVKTKNIQKGDTPQISFVSAEMQGWRKNMQDSSIHQLDIGDGNSLFAVFDGHGGFQISLFLSRVFAKELIKLEAYQNKLYQKALIEVFQNIDQLMKSPDGQKELKVIHFKTQLIEEFQDEFIGTTVGCTANIVLITKEQIVVANVGDSRSVLCRSGKAVALSEDHKPEMPKEEARIKKAGGSIMKGRVNGGLNLTRSLGDFDYKKDQNLPYDEQLIICRPQVLILDRIKEDSFILMGCDGIWERYQNNNQAIIDMLSSSMSKTADKQKIISDLLQGLIATDISTGLGCDNMTAILIFFNR